MIRSRQSGYTRAFTFVFAVCILMLPVTNMLLARQVYKSVDANGNVTYSSFPPKEATQTEKMKIPGKTNPATNVQDNSNIKRMKNLAGEMEKERIQRQGDRAAANKKREEARAKKQDEKAKKQAEIKAAEPKDRYYPIYVPTHPGNPDRLKSAP